MKIQYLNVLDWMVHDMEAETNFRKERAGSWLGEFPAFRKGN